MSIDFTIEKNHGYYIASFTGRITDEEMLTEYERFFNGGDWSPELNELTDLSVATWQDVTSKGIEALANKIKEFATLHSWDPSVAVYAPDDLPYGLARIYGVYSKKFETRAIFRDLGKAKAWLRDRQSR